MNLRMGLREEIRVFITYRIVWRIGWFLHFLRLASLMLIGKVGIMDGEPTASRGGYWYYTYILTPLQVTKDKDRMLKLMHEKDPEEKEDE